MKSSILATRKAFVGGRSMSLPFEVGFVTLVSVTKSLHGCHIHGKAKHRGEQEVD
jgi:hypothetical protein